MIDFINKPFFDNINGLVRIFTIKKVNFILNITPLNEDLIPKKTIITYHFVNNIINFPNNIQEIYYKLKYLKTNLSYFCLNNQLLNFNLEIYDKNIKMSQSINIYYNDFINIKNYSNNNENEIIDNFLDFIVNNKSKDTNNENDENDDNDNNQDEIYDDFTNYLLK